MTVLKTQYKKTTLTIALVIATMILAACGGGGTSGTAETSSVRTTVSESTWIAENTINSACCNYAQIFIDGPTPDAPTRVYTNSDLSRNSGGLHLYEGTLDGVNDKGRLFTIDAPRDAYIRTFGMTKKNGKYYALLYTGTAYPPAEGFSPSWATSDDGLQWKWAGPVSPYKRSFSSAQALVAEPDGSFKAWIDAVGGTLREMSSPDGLVWKDQGDIWPASLPAGQAVFPNATRTPNGTMLAVADAFPATKIRTLWKCNADLAWSVLEENAPIHNGQKGAALAWDGARIHAYANGAHWSRGEPSCPVR